MRLMKEEKIWIVVVLICFAAFLMPGFPKYGDVKGTFIHSIITLGALWISNYAGQMWVNSKLEFVEEDVEKD